MFFSKAKMIINIENERLVVGDLRIDPATFFELTYKDDLTQAFDQIIAKLPSKNYKIILSEDVSYTILLDKAASMEDRATIRAELAKRIPENFEEDQFDWKITPEGKIVAIVLTGKIYKALKKIRTKYPNIKFETQSAISLLWEMGKPETPSKVTQELFAYSASKGREKGGDDMVLNVEIENTEPETTTPVSIDPNPSSSTTPLSQALPVKQKSNKWLLVSGFIILIILIGITGWFMIFKKQKEATVIPMATTTPSPVPSPITSVEKSPSEYKVLIQNGSGVVGLAASYKTKLEALSFSQIETGNASTPSATTKIMVSSALPDQVQNTFLETLKPLQAEVIVAELDDALSINDIVIILGSK